MFGKVHDLPPGPRSRKKQKACRLPLIAASPARSVHRKCEPCTCGNLRYVKLDGGPSSGPLHASETILRLVGARRGFLPTHRNNRAGASASTGSRERPYQGARWLLRVERKWRTARDVSSTHSKWGPSNADLRGVAEANGAQCILTPTLNSSRCCRSRRGQDNDAP